MFIPFLLLLAADGKVPAPAPPPVAPATVPPPAAPPLAPVITADPPPEAIALGRELAQAGTLAALLPLMIAKDIDALVQDHPELSVADRDLLRGTAQASAREAVAKLMASVGRAYAERLSIADLRTLLAQAMSPAAANRRAAEPAVILAAMGALSGFDLKQQAIANFCRDTGKLCPEKAGK